MRSLPSRFLCALIPGLLILGASGCDRRIEPFDPEEEPARPDLSSIFPEGAQQSAAPAAPSLPEPPSAASGGASEAGEAPIRGSIRLGDGLAGRVPAGAVLFLVARPGAAGPPLAVLRIPSPHFPLDFEIGPENRMIQSLPFRGPLRLTARVDSDGDAGSRTPGDLQGAAPGTYQPGDSGVVLVLDEVL